MKASKVIAAGLILVSALSCNKTPVTDYEPAPFGTYAEGLIGNVEPQGWIKEFLLRQESGLSGHPEELGYPYNTCLWDGEIAREREGHGSEWWRYEQTAYYSDGLLRLGYLLGNKDFISKVENGIHYTLSHLDENGCYGLRWPLVTDSSLDEYNYQFWPQAVYFRAIQAYYYKTGDESVIPVLENHFLSIPKDILRRARNAVNIEGILWTYSLTGNPDLLDLARYCWEDGQFWLREEERLTEPRLYQHGVTCCEQLKLPVLLYAYTGEEKYLETALRIEERLEDEDLLPDGVISSSEYLAGKTVNHSHETCDICDYSWTLGYFLMTTGEARWGDMIERAAFNACPGAIGKDFKSLQYLSSVNQFICTSDSNNNDFKKGTDWMQYMPYHQVECCAGNVHRIMPDYVSRMWLMNGPDNVVAALFGPSKLRVRLSDGSNCRITEKTEYPFSDDIDFLFEFSMPGKHNMEFSFRVPEWADDFKAEVNGNAANFEITPGGFAVLDSEFKTGDRIHVSFIAPIEVKDLDNQGCYVERGPLLFTYAIPASCTEDPKEGVHNFKSWNFVPSAKWNYALCDIDAENLELKWTGSKAYPFDEPKCFIKVPVKEIEGWTLDEDRFTPENPSTFNTVEDSEVNYIDLTPYGGSYIRLTVFPVCSR